MDRTQMCAASYHAMSYDVVYPHNLIHPHHSAVSSNVLHPVPANRRPPIPAPARGRCRADLPVRAPVALHCISDSDAENTISDREYDYDADTSDYDDTCSTTSTNGNVTGEVATDTTAQEHSEDVEYELPREVQNELNEAKDLIQ